MVQSVQTAREKDALRKKEERLKQQTIVIPPCADKRRRKRLEKNDEAWLKFYFGPGCELEDVFTYEFTEQQKKMIQAIAQSLDFGLDKAMAASRGEGKSTILERLVLKKHLQGKIDYTVILQATGPLAAACIDSIKYAIENNPLLAADYPEVCVPVIALEGAPQKAQTQKVTGVRYDNGKPFTRHPSKFTWAGDEIIFPNVPGSPSAKSIITAKGLESAVRGLRKRGKRPKLAVIDDPDTEDTAASQDQSKKLEKRIDAALALLGGQKRKVARVMISTIQSRISVSFRYTDPKIKPSFRGERFRFLVKKPDRMDLWDEYVQMHKDDQVAGDPFARRAHKFYLDNRKEMELGGKVSNPNRFDDTLLADGTKLEVSAFQRYFNIVAQIGQEFASTELDNDPPEDSAVIETGIEARRIQRKVNGFDRRVIPPGFVLLTQGIDCRKSALHWVIRAWMADGTGATIDYGIHEVHGTVYGSEEGVDIAIRRAILERIEATGLTQYVKHGTEEAMPVDLTLVDAGWQTDAVYGACFEAGAGVMPVMGCGKSAGCVYTNFHDVLKVSLDKQPGDGWFLSRKGRLWLVLADTDRWKQWEHNRWLTAEDQPGCMTIFGQRSEHAERLSQDEKEHHSYARHICNEKEVEKPFKGVLKRVWIQKSDNNHWLDASYYSDVAASMRGIKLSAEAPSLIKPVVLGAVRRDNAKRKSLSQMRKDSVI
jgi:hypothetical protein